MDLGLAGKVAVVTASSQGLGRAVAEALAREGMKLAVCSRDAGRIAEAGEALRREHGAEVLALPCDVTDAEAVDLFSGAVLEAYRTVHVLFTNAGGPPAGGVLEVTTEDYRRALDLNLLSTIRLTERFLPSMKAQRWGRIVASTSVTVKQPIPTLALSNVSRVGVVAFVKSLSREVARLGITANAVAPGYIMTERVRDLLQGRVEREGVSFEEARAGVESQIPAGRVGAPGEFAALVAFLASEPASYVNGETILVDGGLHRGLF